jgi:intein/homing endonuclease
MDNQQGNLSLSLEQVLEPVAYSIGALLGDGSVKQYTELGVDGKLIGPHKVVISNMDKECIERVCGEINQFCKTAYEINSYTNPNGTLMYHLAICDKSIYTFFYYFIREKTFLADEIFKASRQARLDFLAGLFDTDGTIAHKTGYYRIGYAARIKTLVEDVARLLQKLGVKVGKIHEQISGFGTTMYIIKPNIRSFIDAGCYFYIPRKVERLYEYLRTVQRHTYTVEIKPSETIMPDPKHRVMI